MSDNSKPYESLVYFALALDPVHVGTGGLRLGRVDMSIVREPGTNLPKIPGTSLAGACRTYAAMQENGKFPHCAGQGQAQGNYQGHCGQHDCPICVTFGFSKGDQGSFQGLAQFSDARLVLFPVHSLAGPVWVTCPDVLRDFVTTQPSVRGTKQSASIGPEIASQKALAMTDTQVRVASGLKIGNQLNLGWLLLDVAGNDFSLDALNLPPEIAAIAARAVLVSSKLFGQIVNDNLEVRTSVSIDPQTGAASEGALFTYEALPRASVLAFEVVVSHPKFYRVNGNIPLEGKMETVKQTAQNGLMLFDALGVGGMNTRGMGRMRVWPKDEGGRLKDEEVKR